MVTASSRPSENRTNAVSVSIARISGHLRHCLAALEADRLASWGGASCWPSSLADRARAKKMHNHRDHRSACAYAPHASSQAATAWPAGEQEGRGRCESAFGCRLRSDSAVLRRAATAAPGVVVVDFAEDHGDPPVLASIKLPGANDRPARFLHVKAAKACGPRRQA